MDPEADELKAWRSSNPSAPRDWLVLADRLASHRDMHHVWIELRKRGAAPLAVFSDVCEAFRHAHNEDRRPTTKLERQNFDRVKYAARRLKRAINDSSLPANSGTFCELPCEGQKSVSLLVGWRNLPADGYGLAYPLSVLDFLDLVEQLVDSGAETLPPRSTARQRGRHLESAFVRWLAFFFRQRFGAELHATIARLASAALDLKDTLDKNNVEAILKDSPPQFRPSQLTKKK